MPRRDRPLGADPWGIPPRSIGWGVWENSQAGPLFGIRCHHRHLRSISSKTRAEAPHRCQSSECRNRSGASRQPRPTPLESADSLFRLNFPADRGRNSIIHPGCRKATHPTLQRRHSLPRRLTNHENGLESSSRVTGVKRGGLSDMSPPCGYDLPTTRIGRLVPQLYRQQRLRTPRLLDPQSHFSAGGIPCRVDRSQTGPESKHCFRCRSPGFRRPGHG